MTTAVKVSPGWSKPVILISGHPRERNMSDLRALGIRDWLPKPPNLEDLAQAIAAALRPGKVPGNRPKEHE